MSDYDSAISALFKLRGPQVPHWTESYKAVTSLRDLMDERRIREQQLQLGKLKLEEEQRQAEDEQRTRRILSTHPITETTNLTQMLEWGLHPKVAMQLDADLRQRATARSQFDTAEIARKKAIEDQERARQQRVLGMQAGLLQEHPAAGYQQGTTSYETPEMRRAAESDVAQMQGLGVEGQPTMVMPTQAQFPTALGAVVGPEKAQKYMADVAAAKAAREKAEREEALYPIDVRTKTAQAKHAQDVALGTQPESPHEQAMREQGALPKNILDWVRIKNDPNSPPEQRKLAEANIADYQKLHPEHAAALAPGATETDAQDIADAIERGERKPDTKGLYKTGVAVGAILARKHYNLARAELDWHAINRHLSTLNSASQERLRQAIDFTYHSLDTIDDLYKQWTEKGLNTRFGSLNKLSLAAAKQLGGDAGAIAQGLETQINDLTSEMATVYKGGNASTDEGLRLASENLKGNWNETTFKKSMELLRNNLRIRRNSILSSEPVGVSPGSPYLPPAAPGGATPTGGVPKVGDTLPNGEKVKKVTKVQ